MSLETIVKNQSVPAESASLVPTPFDRDEFDASVMATYGRFPIALERGLGCRVWDTEGREYLDFVAGIATCTLHHCQLQT